MKVLNRFTLTGLVVLVGVCQVVFGGPAESEQVDLAFATGTLLGAAKVRWEPIVPESDV